MVCLLCVFLMKCKNVFGISLFDSFLFTITGNSKALSDIRRLVADPGYHPKDPKELCNRIFVTVYMGTKNSSEETRNRAALLASQIGSHHLSILIDKAVSAMMEIFTDANPGCNPKFSGE